MSHNVQPAFRGLTALLVAAVLTVIGCSNDDQPVEPEPNSVFGVVVEAEIERPLPKVNVSVGGLTTRTNGKGQYSIEGLSKGTFIITATLSAYEDYSAEITVNGRTQHNIELHLQLGG